MKIAVIGTGKTGSEIIKLIPPKQLLGTFNSRNPVTLESLALADAVIVFVPGPALLELLPLLQESRKLVVCGSTGFHWPENFHQQLVAQGTTWLTASNFCLGMNLVFMMTKKLAQFAKQFPQFEFHIDEIHHVHKKDKPSGTALTLKKMIGFPAKIHSQREGDVKGVHEVILKTPLENISLKHEALDRALFAQGALWATEKLLQKKLGPGLHFLEDVLLQLSPELGGP